MPPEALDRIVDRLERAAAELRSGDLDPERAAALVDECARLAAEAGTQLDREVRAVDGPGPAGQLALDQLSYPEHLRGQVEDYLAALRFADEPAAAGLEEAMRYSLLAGGKRIRPVLALATASALGREPATVLPLAAALELIHTYSPDPRRPAGDGRRRPAPRAADLPRQVRRGRRDPRRRRALRGGVPPPAARAGRASRSACSRPPPSWPPRRA